MCQGMCQRCNDLVQSMYRESEGLDEIKRAINFPKLEMPPADFLQNMEDYARQAPRQFDDSGPKKVSQHHAAYHASMCNLDAD